MQRYIRAYVTRLVNRYVGLPYAVNTFRSGADTTSSGSQFYELVIGAEKNRRLTVNDSHFNNL